MPPRTGPDPEEFLPLHKDTFQILVALADADRHGYSIMLDDAALPLRRHIVWRNCWPTPALPACCPNGLSMSSRVLSPHAVQLAGRAFGALLLCYPAEFRQEYARE